MKSVSYTLLGDGPSDRMLMQVIDWALRVRSVPIEQRQWADFGLLREKPLGLGERIQCAIQFYPCDILFIHRDAEKEPYQNRLQEIQGATRGLGNLHVPVIPVRMTEAWFLHDEDAIRTASGNPNGRSALGLPPPKKLESLSDPKETLYKALMTATEISGQRLKKLAKPSARSAMRARVAELILSFEPLIGVPAFDAFLQEVDDALQRR